VNPIPEKLEIGLRQHSVTSFEPVVVIPALQVREVVLQLGEFLADFAGLRGQSADNLGGFENACGQALPSLVCERTRSNLGLGLHAEEILVPKPHSGLEFGYNLFGRGGRFHDGHPIMRFSG
jgi:hypothetical protein